MESTLSPLHAIGGCPYLKSQMLHNNDAPDTNQNCPLGVSCNWKAGLPHPQSPRNWRPCGDQRIFSVELNITHQAHSQNYKN